LADTKSSTNVYNLLAGVNTKASDYVQNQAGFRDLRNFDFFVPNAISKRPGSTQMVGSGTSGPITSLFEFQKLSGESYIVAGSDTAMFYLAAGAFTLLSSGWNNGQPTDMLTFQNKLWMANGQKWQKWDGNTLYSLGLFPAPGITTDVTPTGSGGGSQYLVAGNTALLNNSSLLSLSAEAIWIAYSYVRNDGFLGPIDFMQSAQQIVRPALGWLPVQGAEWFGTSSWGSPAGPYLSGFTAPTGVTAFKIWVARDYIRGSWRSANGGSGIITTGELGLGNGIEVESFGGFRTTYFSNTLSPYADLSQFKFLAVIPASTQTYAVANFNWASFQAQATPGFSGLNFNFYATYFPKYIEQNQNVMFAAGFSVAPSTVAFSEIGEPEYFSEENNFEVRTNDGDVVTGMKAYGNNVIITKEKSFSKIIGSTPEDLALVELSAEFGNLSNKSMIEYEQKLGWLDKRGWLEYNGSSWELISTPVEPMFRRMNLAAAREKACAVNHQYRNQVWIGVPIDGSTQNNITVVYDYLVGAWTFFDGFNPASFALAKGQLNTPTVWRGDYSGLVYSFGESLFGDNGMGITCYGMPNWEIDAGQNSTSIWRRFFLDVASQTSGLTGEIRGRAFSNYDASTVQETFTIPQNVFQTRAEIGVVGKAVTADFSHHSASLPLVIKGFSWTKRFLRNV